MQTRRPKHSSTIEEFVSKEERPNTYGRGRRCRSCRAFLSMYNPFDRCDPCKPQGRRIHRSGGEGCTPDVLDFQEWTEGINFGAMMEEVA